MRKHSNFGFSTILLAFVMICILTFSALALVSANSDYRLSLKLEENNTAYYAAEETAYQTLEAIDEALENAYIESSDKDAYFYLAAKKAADVCSGDIAEDADGLKITYETTIREDMALEVVLLVCYPTADTPGFYQILTWKSVHETGFVEDEPLHLIGNDD